MDDAIRNAAVTLATRAARLRYLQQNGEDMMVDLEKCLLSMARSRLQELVLALPEEDRASSARGLRGLMREVVAAKSRSLSGNEVLA